MKIHRNVSSSQEALAERNLFAAVASLRSADECRAFFRDLCTPAEIQAMADRWAVVDWLMRGVPYREINRLTGVSVTTISRVARCLADGTGGYSLVVRRGQGGRRTPAAKRTETQRGAGNGRRSDSARRVEAARHG
jgi:TrpR-related protein YerC/YecD